MIKITVTLSSIMLFCLFPFSSAHAIKKCQDAEGKWHYGDIAVTQCNTSKVTTLNSRGFVASEKSAPKTDEQLQNEKIAQELADAEVARKQAEEAERHRILSIYETEADIDRQRDNQINSVDSNIAVHKAYLKSVRAKVLRLEEKGVAYKGARKKSNDEEIKETQARIVESSTELESLIAQKKSIMTRFAYEKKLYLELKKPT